MALFDPKFYEHEQQETQPFVGFLDQPHPKRYSKGLVLVACTIMLATLLVML